MKYLVLLAMLLCFTAFSQESTEEASLDITAVESLIGCHLAENQASIIAVKEGTSDDDSSLSAIESVLSKSDNYLELDFALDVLKKFTKPTKGLVPVYRLFLEKLQNATLAGRRDLGETRKKISDALEKLLSHDLDRNLLDTAARRGIAVISIEDDSKKRRADLFREIIKKHRAELISSSEQATSSGKNTLYNFVVEGNETFVGNTTAHYQGFTPKAPFTVKISMKSGGFFTEKWDVVTAKAPADMKVNGSISWIKNQVIAEGWKFIKENHPDFFEKHAKIKDVDGRKVYKIDNGVLKYEVFAPEKSILVETAERNDGDVYLDL